MPDSPKEEDNNIRNIRGIGRNYRSFRGANHCFN
jgi:hypothetical protein